MKHLGDFSVVRSTLHPLAEFVKVYEKKYRFVWTQNVKKLSQYGHNSKIGEYPPPIEFRDLADGGVRFSRVVHEGLQLFPRRRIGNFVFR